MEVSGVLIASLSIVAAALHAWAGLRHVLPRLFAMQAFAEMLTPTLWVRRAFVVVWLMGTLGILGFAAFLPIVHALESRERVQVFVYSLAALIGGSPMILGTYLGFVLRSKTQHLGLWFTFVLWAVLILVIVVAWEAAGGDANGAAARSNAVFDGRDDVN